MVTVSLLVIATWLVALSSAAPTKIDRAVGDFQDQVFSILDSLCSSRSCLFGKVTFDPESFSCSCPDWPDRLFPDPCDGLKCRHGSEPFYSVIARACYCSKMEDWYKLEEETYNNILKADQESALQLRRRDTSTTLPVDAAIPSFIPPPKQDITPELINQSLTVQPQNTATVSSIIPYFKDDVFRVFMQLNGLVAETLAVNASTLLPCGGIGLADPQPNLALVPKIVQQGQGEPQVVVADCQCIAINMYSPTVITYWIQKLGDGNVFSVVGSNKVTDIDKMDTSQGAALSLVTLGSHNKRSPPNAMEYLQPVRRQIFSIQCDAPCPFYHMHQIKGGDGYCGCMFNEDEEQLRSRGIAEPDVHNAKMTPEACIAMTCFNSGGEPRPAVFNPFSLTCWCTEQPYIESSPDAWSGSS